MSILDDDRKILNFIISVLKDTGRELFNKYGLSSQNCYIVGPIIPIVYEFCAVNPSFVSTPFLNRRYRNKILKKFVEYITNDTVSNKTFCVDIVIDDNKLYNDYIEKHKSNRFQNFTDVHSYYNNVNVPVSYSGVNNCTIIELIELYEYEHCCGYFSFNTNTLHLTKRQLNCIKDKVLMSSIRRCKSNGHSINTPAQEMWESIGYYTK